MLEFWKKTGYYFLKLQLNVLVIAYTCTASRLFLSFFLERGALFLAIEVGVGFLAEIGLCVFFTKNEMGKRTSLKDILYPFVVATVFRFLVALINGFYIYTAGMAANRASFFWETLVRGEYVDRMANIALWRRILTFIPMQLLLCLTVCAVYQHSKKTVRRDNSFA